MPREGYDHGAGSSSSSAFHLAGLIVAWVSARGAESLYIKCL